MSHTEPKTREDFERWWDGLTYEQKQLFGGYAVALKKWQENLTVLEGS